MTAFEVNSSEEDNEINFYHQRSCPSCQRLFYCECDPFKMTLKVLATFSKKQCSIEVDSFVINILNKSSKENNNNNKNANENRNKIKYVR